MIFEAVMKELKKPVEYRLLDPSGNQVGAVIATSPPFAIKMLASLVGGVIPPRYRVIVPESAKHWCTVAEEKIALEYKPPRIDVEDKPAFTVASVDGRVMSVYEDGRIEGFPPEYRFVVNRIPTIKHQASVAAAEDKPATDTPDFVEKTIDKLTKGQVIKPLRDQLQGALDKANRDAAVGRALRLP